MENISQSTITNAKKMVVVLNQAKQRTFGDKTELRDFLKKEKCPYSAFLVPYLSRTQEILGQNNSNFICFKDRKPYYFGDFISVIERFKSQKKKYNYQSCKNRECVETPTTETPTTETLLVQIEKREATTYSKWNKFWIKFFFGITV